MLTEQRLLTNSFITFRKDLSQKMNTGANLDNGFQKTSAWFLKILQEPHCFQILKKSNDFEKTYLAKQLLKIQNYDNSLSVTAENYWVSASYHKWNVGLHMQPYNPNCGQHKSRPTIQNVLAFIYGFCGSGNFCVIFFSVFWLPIVSQM